MLWLKSIGSSIYAYGAIAITILLAFIGYQNKKIKRETKRADNAEANEKLLVKTRKVEQVIDKQMADDEVQAKLKQLRDIKDLGEITNEVDNITDSELINHINRLLNDKHAKDGRDSTKIPG